MNCEYMFQVFRIIFTVLIGLNVSDLIPNICCHIFFRSYNHSIFLVGFWFGLIWFDLVCELYLVFQNVQFEMNFPSLGSKKGDLFSVLSPQIFL